MKEMSRSVRNVHSDKCTTKTQVSNIGAVVGCTCPKVRFLTLRFWRCGSFSIVNRGIQWSVVVMSKLSLLFIYLFHFIYLFIYLLHNLLIKSNYCKELSFFSWPFQKKYCVQESKALSPLQKVAKIYQVIQHPFYSTHLICLSSDNLA